MSNMTRIAVDLPEDIAKRLESAWRDLSRGTLEAVAAEGYRDGTLSRDQVGRLLGFSFWETEAFLKERQAYLAYDEQDLDQDRRDLDNIRPR
jgi:predicted HTH domain antitoxin